MSATPNHATESGFPTSNRPKPGMTLHPLGPIVFRIAADRPVRARTTAAGVFVGCALLLLVASRLAPAKQGFGSHQQLGLPPCSLLVIVGYPCPTCGMTTAYSHAVRGQLVSAFHAQPAGLFLASATVVAASLALSTMLTGRVWMVNWYRVAPTWIVLGLVFIVIGGWLYKLGAGIASGTLPLTG